MDGCQRMSACARDSGCMRFELRSVIWLLLLTWRSVASTDSMADDSTRLHVVTFMNNPDRHYAYLQVTAEAHGLYPVIIGYGQEAWWPDGLGAKINALRSYLFSQVNDQDVLLFVDAFDVLVFGDKKEILDRFSMIERKSNRSLVFNAEQYCFPRDVSGGEGVCDPDKYPPAPFRWRHLNSGVFAGRGHAVKKMLKDPVPNVIKGSDQKWYQKYFLSHQEEIQLDYQCLLMCAISGDSKSEGVAIQDDRVFIPETGNFPALVHCVSVAHWNSWRGGKATHALHELFSRFYPSAAARLLDGWRIEADLGTTHTMQIYQGDAWWGAMRSVLCIQCGFLGSPHQECKFFPNRFDNQCWLVSSMFIVAVLAVPLFLLRCVRRYAAGADVAVVAEDARGDSTPGTPSKRPGHGAQPTTFGVPGVLDYVMRGGRPAQKLPEFIL